MPRNKKPPEPEYMHILLPPEYDNIFEQFVPEDLRNNERMKSLRIKWILKRFLIVADTYVISEMNEHREAKTTNP